MQQASQSIVGGELGGLRGYDLHFQFGVPLATPKGAPLGKGCQGYPKVKMKINFGFPTIENPRIDITHEFWWYTPLETNYFQ